VPLVIRKDTPETVPHEDGRYGELYHDAYGRLWSHVGELPHWESSGAILASGVIKASPGLLGGVVVTASDADGDIEVNIYDNATKAAAPLLATLRLTAKTIGAQTSFGALAGGIIAHEGIYLDMSAGHCMAIVYYE